MASRGRGPYSPRNPGKAPLKGLFADGVWLCNCQPRAQAERFQTKNGGINHGRWFYTCQKSQPKRCNFFLWEDDAKPREAATLLNNARTEKHAEDVPGAKDDKIGEVPSAINATEMPPPETPRKAIKSDQNGSPGKRKFEEAETPGARDEDVFTTPATGMKGRGLFAGASLMSPAETPTPQRVTRMAFSELELDAPVSLFQQRGSPIKSGETDFARELLGTLRELKVDLSREATEAIQTACLRQALRTQGIERGRDISRAVIKTKEAKITELQAKIKELEAERKSDKDLIQLLKQGAEIKRES